MFRKTLVQTMTVLLIGLVVILLWQAIPILLLFFAGSLLAVLFTTFARQLSSLTRLSYRLSLTIVLLIFILAFGTLVWLIVPYVGDEMNAFTEKLEASLVELVEWLEDTEWGSFLAEQLSATLEQIGEGSEVWQQMAGVFSTTIGALAGFALIFFIGIFLSYNPHLYLHGFLRLVAPPERPRTSEVLSALGHTIRWWMIGQLISMTVLAVSTWIMLTLLGVPLAFLLALFTGILTFIPYLGPIVAFFPIVLIAFVESPTTALFVTIFYLIIQNAEANILMPIVFHRTVRIPPALGVVTQILFGTLFGFLGFVLATPLMAIAIVTVRMLYVEDFLGDSMDNPVEVSG